MMGALLGCKSWHPPTVYGPSGLESYGRIRLLLIKASVLRGFLSPRGWVGGGLLPN